MHNQINHITFKLKVNLTVVFSSSRHTERNESMYCSIFCSSALSLHVHYSMEINIPKFIGVKYNLWQGT